jgi:hypothetical protein
MYLLLPGGNIALRVLNLAPPTLKRRRTLMRDAGSHQLIYMVSQLWRPKNVLHSNNPKPRTLFPRLVYLKSVPVIMHCTSKHSTALLYPGLTLPPHLHTRDHFDQRVITTTTLQIYQIVVRERLFVTNWKVQPKHQLRPARRLQLFATISHTQSPQHN